MNVPLTMRQLLDILKSATDSERQEFSEWWAGLPVPRRKVETLVGFKEVGGVKIPIIEFK